MSSSCSENGGESGRVRVVVMVSCRAGTVSGGLLLASGALPDLPLQPPLCSYCSLPEPWRAGMDTGEVRRGSYVQAWAGAGASRAAAAGVALQLQHGGTQTCLFQLPALPMGGHGVVVVVWGLGEGQELGEWVHDVEVGLVWWVWKQT